MLAAPVRLQSMIGTLLRCRHRWRYLVRRWQPWRIEHEIQTNGLDDPAPCVFDRAFAVARANYGIPVFLTLLRLSEYESVAARHASGEAHVHGPATRGRAVAGIYFDGQRSHPQSVRPISTRRIQLSE